MANDWIHKTMVVNLGIWTDFHCIIYYRNSTYFIIWSGTALFLNLGCSSRTGCTVKHWISEIVKVKGMLLTISIKYCGLWEKKKKIIMLKKDISWWKNLQGSGFHYWRFLGQKKEKSASSNQWIYININFELYIFFYLLSLNVCSWIYHTESFINYILKPSQLTKISPTSDNSFTI